MPRPPRLPMLESPGMYLGRRARELGNPELAEYVEPLPAEAVPYLNALGETMPFPPGSRPPLSEECEALIRSVAHLAPWLRELAAPFVLPAVVWTAFGDAFLVE